MPEPYAQWTCPGCGAKWPFYKGGAFSSVADQYKHADKSHPGKECIDLGKKEREAIFGPDKPFEQRKKEFVNKYIHGNTPLQEP